MNDEEKKDLLEHMAEMRRLTAIGDCVMEPLARWMEWRMDPSAPVPMAQAELNLVTAVFRMGTSMLALMTPQDLKAIAEMRPKGKK